jgi:TolB-like protein
MPPPSPAESADSPPEHVPGGTAVRDQLARILSSPGFASSARLCRFLTHIVNRTLERDPDSLKEFSIAMAVFDRKADYDSNIDAIVRVEARRLRAKLKAYYEKANDPLMIDLRPGSYVPVFRWLRPKPEAVPRAEVKPGQPPSVAVLPFINMSPERDQEFFCDGMTEEILNSLAQLAGLKVIARTSAFQFKGVAIDIREVGQRLGADLVIEGSVRKAGEQLRVTAQAVETVSGHHLWSKTFQHALKDVFKVQEEIAEAIADLFRVNSPPRPAAHPNFDAYTRYLRTRFLIHQQTPEALQAAVRQLHALIELFPDYAAGYSGIAAANGLLCLFGVVSGRDVYRETKEFAERGYALDAESAETCTVLGGFRAWFEYRWKEAETLYDRALELQPGHANAHVYRGMTLLCQGQVREAGSSLRRALDLDPLSASDCARMAYIAYLQEDDPRAGEQLARAFELDRDYPEARFYDGLLRFRREDYEGVLQRLSSLPAPLDLGLLAAAYARLGQRQAAVECVQRLRHSAQTRFVTPLGEALAAIGMRDFDSAFQLLSEAIDHRTNFMNLLALEPFFQPLRKDSRFPKLLKKLNLSD